LTRGQQKGFAGRLTAHKKSLGKHHNSYLTKEM